MATIDSTAVARELLSLANQENIPLDPLKMMKLVYLCHGWGLALLQDGIINEEVEAWQYGPVIPDLYQHVRQYRAAPIQHLNCMTAEPSQSQKSLIKAVFDAYKNFSGVQLSNMTHAPGTPWSETWDQNGRNATIPTALIKRHFEKLRDERAS